MSRRAREAGSRIAAAAAWAGRCDERGCDGAGVHDSPRGAQTPDFVPGMVHRPPLRRSGDALVGVSDAEKRGRAPAVQSGCAARQSGVLLAACQHGFAITPTSCPMAGTTSPCTLAGTLLMANVENVFVAALSQIVNPGGREI